MKHELKPSDISTILHVLNYYAKIDDQMNDFMKGFAARPEEHDEHSPARRCMKIITQKTGISV